jgi:hypothetical protein
MCVYLPKIVRFGQVEAGRTTKTATTTTATATTTVTAATASIVIGHELPLVSREVRPAHQLPAAGRGGLEVGHTEHDLVGVGRAGCARRESERTQRKRIDRAPHGSGKWVGGKPFLGALSFQILRLADFCGWVQPPL